MTLRVFIGGLAIAAVLGGAIGVGAAIVVVPHVVGAGPRGPQGVQGLVGAMGLPGTDGATGLSGAQGPPGLDATVYHLSCITDANGSYGTPVVTGISTDTYPPYQTHISNGYLQTRCTAGP